MDRLTLSNARTLQSSAAILVFPALTSGIARRNTSLLATVVGTGPPPSGLGMIYAVLCNDQVPQLTPEAIAAALEGVRPEIAHVFQVSDLGFFKAACEGWTAVTPNTPMPLVGDVPTLILAGEYDTAVPPSLAREVATTLSHSTVLEFRGYGHGVLYTFPPVTGPPRCAMSVVAQFTHDPMQPLDTSCVDAIPAPDFL